MHGWRETERKDAGMRLIEIRDLDGPNIFLLQPAIKIELQLEGNEDLDTLISEAADVIGAIHRRHGLAEAPVSGRRLETPNHIAIVFPWRHRRFAIGVAERFVSTAIDGETVPDDAQLADMLRSPDAEDRPLMITDAERKIPVVAITGTNGKTTTTRLLAHILMRAGKHVGWSSTSGVYIDGAEVLSGDYSGPAGARRILEDPVVEIGVFETARGGILLRGLACESNDVSVFTNISADHLNLHGIRSVEGLAEVKAVIPKTTRRDGVAVMNADDPLVIAATAAISAEKLFFSRQPQSALIERHLERNGRALVSRSGHLEFFQGNDLVAACELATVPMTYGGRAGHMVENAMAATGAAIGLGLPFEQVVAGLQSFRSSTEQNLGRLNLFDIDGVKVVIDFAHNEAGLIVLLDFAHQLVAGEGRVTVVIGTAGDRTDESLREIGRIAGEGADRVIVKRTKKYERGRSNEEMIALYREGGAIAGHPQFEVSADELTGLQMALKETLPGDVVALMCQEQLLEVASELQRLGKPIG